MGWYRVDNRLIHGQIIEAWLPFTGAKYLIVADDALAENDIQQQIMSLAVPDRVEVHFLSISDTASFLCQHAANEDNIFVVFSRCCDARRLFEEGIAFPILNLGNMHYASGKQQLCAHIAASEDDLRCFSFLKSHGVLLDFRCVPNDTTEVKEW